MTRYAVQQHGAFAGASSKRKHLNTLLLDQSKEIDNIYGLAPSMSYTAGLQGTLRASAGSGTLVYADTAGAILGEDCQKFSGAEAGTRGTTDETAPLDSTYGTCTIGKTTPWQQPWQTGDREAGKAMANAIRAKRVYGGGFACFDLAKAPK